MFRNSLRRCANQARATATASLLSQTRTTLPIARRQIVPVLSTLSPLNRIASISRAYSSEASAAQDEAPVAAPTDAVPKFADLEGVHPNLITAITEGMSYDNMTPVQAKTITPALKGTDM